MSYNRLTGNQERFVQEYIKHRSPIEAYRTAYDATRMRPSTAYRNAYRLMETELVKSAINERLAQLGEDLAEENKFTASHALQMFLDLAAADPDELSPFRIGCCRYCWGDGFNYQWRVEAEWLEALREAERAGREDFPLPDGGFGFNHTLVPNEDCPRCSGEGVARIVPRDTSKLSPGAKMLFQGVKPTKDGTVFMFGDRQRALENAAKIVGAFIEKVDLNVRTADVDQAELDKLDATRLGQLYTEVIKRG